jgi:hypothetical protein|tara:strand:- start:372 stop:809 length:438 start_codon:yes stop_codon:yes gene_type:complete
MSTPKPCFQFEGFYDQLPDPGFYPAGIKSARFKRSAAKNHMLEVVFTLESVESAYQQVADYFVLEGERVSHTAIFLARRRLMQLYRACRLFPKGGDEIVPKQLLNARVKVCIEHEEWQGRSQLRVAAYRPLKDFLDPEEQIPLQG